jgi:hypothetical protein
MSSDWRELSGAAGSAGRYLTFLLMYARMKKIYNQYVLICALRAPTDILQHTMLTFQVIFVSCIIHMSKHKYKGYLNSLSLLQGTQS